MLLLLACSDYDLNVKTEVPGGTDSVCAQPEDFEVPEDSGCLVEPVVGTFEPVVEWQWTVQAQGYDDIMSTPVVGDLNKDGMPDIVFTTFAGGAYTSTGALTATSGDGSGDLFSILEAGGYHFYSSGGVAVGDIDADGAMEACASGVEVAVVCVNPDGSLKWAGGTSVYGYGFPAFADMNNDGQSEVIYGPQVLDSKGNVLTTGAGGTGWWQSFPLDVDNDNVMELVAGNTLYNIDGSIRWQDGSGDGPPAAADFDLDGTPEIVHTSAPNLYLTGADGVIRWGVSIPGGGGGPPTVADFDNDGYPEVGVAGAYYYTVFDTDGSVLWSQAVQDYSSSVTGSSVFDFEGDGASDVVYADEVILWVYDGATGAVKLIDDRHASGTLYEYPLIVDVDADGATEIVLPSNDYTFSGWHGITVIGDATGSWRPSRELWNQFAYSITNIEEDGSIPRYQPPNWRRWNNFRTGGTSLGLSDQLADLEPGEPVVCGCGELTLEILVPVSNSGLADSGEFSVALTISGRVVEEVRLELRAGQGSYVGPFTVEKDQWEKMWIQVDEREEVEECVERDNEVTLGGWPC
jgi:hypothetical protein